MRKLKLQMQLSLDGYVCGPNGEMDWMTWNWDNELKSYVAGLTAPVDIILLGRRLAEGFIPAWQNMAANPETADDFAHKMNSLPRLVFTQTLESSPWENAELVKTDVSEAINELKNQPGEDIIVYGGASFASALIAQNLIDEYHLFINPVALGKGLSIFSALKQNLALQMIHTQAFACGISVLVYQPAPTTE